MLSPSPVFKSRCGVKRKAIWKDRDGERSAASPAHRRQLKLRFVSMKPAPTV